MSKQILDNLFNSRVRVKILRLFFRNFPNEFDMGSLARKVQEPFGETKKEVKALVELGILKKKK